MAYPLFHRRARGDAASTEFAATVLSLPAVDDARPAGPDSRPSLPSGTDSALLGPITDLGADSLPASDSTVELRPTLSHIGRYALKGLLGQGGLGQVHEAWDPLLSRTVAVKTLHFELDTPSRVSLDALFLNEARAAAGLSHPHIVTVHDAGLSARGVYIAMERLYGSDLRQRLAEGWQPTPGQAAQLARRVADALAYAHARGVVHCDIKPANIFLSPRDRPKVLDFGIARVAHRTTLPALEGAIAGSPHYLAPEQLQGSTVDARTDIHALGVVFYELLTLRKAYGGDSVEQITSAVLHHHPPPAHELRPGVPRTLAGIAARAMAREPADRYAGAAEMAADLRRWVDRHSANEPAAPALPGPVSTRPQRKPGPRRTVGALALAGGLVLAGAAAWVVRPVVVPVVQPVVRPVVPGPSAADAGRQPATAPPADAAMAQAPVAASAAGPAPAPDAAPDEPAVLPLPSPSAMPPEAGARAGAAGVPAAARLATGSRTPARPRSGTAPAAARDVRSAAVAVPVAAPSTGFVQLAISPWGQIEVDGSAAGTAPPLARLTLSEGAHQVTVRNDDFPPFTATVQVSADRPVTVRYRFGP